MYSALISIFLWSTIAIVSHYVKHIPAFVVLGWCFSFGSLFALFNLRTMFDRKIVMLYSVLGFFGYHFFLFQAFRYAPILEANLINYLWPMLLIILTPLFFRQNKLSWANWLGSLFCLIGCYLLISSNLKPSEHYPQRWLGIILAGLAALTWPVYSLLSKKIPASNPNSYTGICLITGLLCFMTAWIQDESFVINQASDWLILCYLGLGPFGLAFKFWQKSLHTGDPKLVGTLSYLTPMLSNAWLIIFGNQALSLQTIFAMLLIISGSLTGVLVKTK
jgi:drug/metabolite transporter (DMT)-like permease